MVARETTFDAEAVTRQAVEEVGRVVAEQQARLLRDADAAVESVKLYAAHLASGGEPWVTPVERSPFVERRNAIVNEYVGLLAVYRKWNEARGVDNPLSPFGIVTKWMMAETFLEKAGTPVPLSDLPAHYGYVRATPSVIAETLKEIAVGRPDLVPRKTKVNGRVAYYVRERRDDDPDTIKDGRYSSFDIPEEAA
jgi:hypothetical protein